MNTGTYYPNKRKNYHPVAGWAKIALRTPKYAETEANIRPNFVISKEVEHAISLIKASNMRYISVLFTVFLALTQLQASVDPIDVVIMTDPTSNTVVIRSTIPLSRTTRMDLMDDRGNIVYNAELTEGTFFSKRFPAKYLPTGRYLLQLTDERGRTSMPFHINKGRVFYQPQKAAQAFFPNANLKEERMLVVTYPASVGKPYEVALINGDGQTVFSDRSNSSERVRKSYLLDELSAGTYTIAIRANQDRLTSRAITLK